MVRVLIERQVAEDKAESYHTIMREVRRDAVRAPGYLSGEILRDVVRPHHYVIISTWRGRSDWDAWATSSERTAAMKRLAPTLKQPERITILEPV
jgi:heme-degrading monooxygenase HmoA